MGVLPAALQQLWIMLHTELILTLLVCFRSCTYFDYVPLAFLYIVEGL